MVGLSARVAQNRATERERETSGREERGEREKKAKDVRHASAEAE